MMNSQDFTQWWEQVVLQALVRVELLCPPQYRSAAISLRQLLPKTYATAKKQGFPAGADTGRGYKALPALFNMLLHYCRLIITRSPTLQKFRGFFIHVFGINLKAVGHEIGRADGNALLHILKSFPIVDWSLQNPRDIVVDVGLEVNLLDETLPSDIDGLTLMWKLGALKQLTRPGWRKGHMNAYVHSHVVGGLSAAPRASIQSQFFYWHAYMKDKVLTYHHRDSSTGTGFSPEDGLGNTKRYVEEISQLKHVLKTSPGSYGVRMEWRCGLWTANKILTMDPAIWVQRFLRADAIVSC
jgi:hypothetical protein